MKVALLDPGLVDTIGHHADIDLRIAKAFADRGIEAMIFANHKVTPACAEKFQEDKIPVQKLFRIDAYKRPLYRLGEGPSIWVAVRSMVSSLHHVPDADLWLWPTLTLHQFIAASRFSRVNPMIGCVWFDADLSYRRGPELWAENARQGRSSFVLGTFDAASLQHFSALAPDASLRRLPVPFDGSVQRRRPSKEITIGFFGNHRKERGRELLNALVKTILERGWRAIVQNNKGYQGSGSERCLVLPSFVADLSAEMLHCDVTVWPSDPQKYQNKSSGIVFQSIACGVPIVTPSDCRPRLILEDFGLKYPAFAEASVSQIVVAIERTIAKIDHYKHRAAKAADQWRQQEGTARFVNSILEQIV